MKLKFDASLGYQLDAISAVVDLFEGLPSLAASSEINLGETSTLGLIESELGVGHSQRIDTLALLKNLHGIQERNVVPKSGTLIDDSSGYDFPNFSVEMETGTGKTYVYLRTIFELSRRYGFKKFIIVVPSVAIREGVLASIDLMREHFRGIFENAPFDHFVYDSNNLSKVRQFAISNQIQIMIINIQAFQRDAGDVENYATLTEEQLQNLNRIHREQDKMGGRRPIEYIQATRPIVIIDEPQSVDNTVKAQRAIRQLNPLVALRYSATHINPYNLVYKLDPIRAYDQRLVKQVEVASIRADSNFNDVFIRLESIGYRKGSKTPYAKATIHVDSKSGPTEKSITLKQDSDVAKLTTRSGYDGYVVTNICAEPGLEHVEFANGITLKVEQEQGGLSEDILRSQIRLTVEEHFKKELRFRDRGIKVLSLFFIDRVANYRRYDESGQPVKGKIAVWFEEAYREYSQKPQYNGLIPFPVEEVHDGYFSEDRKRGKVVALKDTSGSTAVDDETYHKIMRDKERLLSVDEPLRFIFSHSALREGWDNPNVFQICTLREMGTDRERRQTLGRGLRLPVDQSGNRILDDSVNKLTVIASESFEEYARGLQSDIERDLGDGFKFGRVPKIAFARMQDPATDVLLGQERSAEVWHVLVGRGYLTADGDITKLFVPEKPGFVLELPDELHDLRLALVDELKRYVFKNRIVDTRKRQKLTFNKRVELNPEFKALWDRISQRTRYRVEFQTADLIARAVAKIADMEPIQAVRLDVEKTEVSVTRAGIESGRILDSRTQATSVIGHLPDILKLLQRDTALTRSTLVTILAQSGRIAEFGINPQGFLTAVTKLIQRALNETVVTGIKYEKLDGLAYEMTLFEDDEIEEYLTRLYEVRSTDNRAPYDFIPFDSEVERDIAEKLDANEAVKFFCKLPRWFVVPTPLGDYNPDWSVVLERDSKLSSTGIVPMNGALRTISVQTRRLLLQLELNHRVLGVGLICRALTEDFDHSVPDCAEVQIGAARETLAGTRCDDSHPRNLPGQWGIDADLNLWLALTVNRQLGFVRSASRRGALRRPVENHELYFFFLNRLAVWPRDFACAFPDGFVSEPSRSLIERRLSRRRFWLRAILKLLSLLSNGLLDRL